MIGTRLTFTLTEEDVDELDEVTLANVIAFKLSIGEYEEAEPPVPHSFDYDDFTCTHCGLDKWDPVHRL